MLSKWVITLKPVTASTSHAGAHWTRRFVTGGQPTKMRSIEITTARMKATTWLRVIAEVIAAMAR